MSLSAIRWKNAPSTRGIGYGRKTFLYDQVTTHIVEWASLTVQWLLDCKEPFGKDGLLCIEMHPWHSYLMLAEVHLPLEDTESDARDYDEERGDVGGFG